MVYVLVLTETTLQLKNVLDRTEITLEGHIRIKYHLHLAAVCSAKYLPYIMCQKLVTGFISIDKIKNECFHQTSEIIHSSGKYIHHKTETPYSFCKMIQQCSFLAKMCWFKNIYFRNTNSGITRKP